MEMDGTSSSTKNDAGRGSDEDERCGLGLVLALTNPGETFR